MSSGLGWSWKPLKGEVPERRKARKQKRKKKKGLLYAPGEVFYESKAWKRLRRRVLDAYGYKCMKCDVVDTEIHIDHIIPRSKAPKLSLSFHNLQVLCRECNLNKMDYHSTDYREAAAARELDLQAALAAKNWI